MKLKPRTLEQVFSKQITRWGVIGLAWAAGIALVLAIGLGVYSNENRLRVTADAAAKAFRPQMLASQDFEHIELQIRDAFHLSAREKISIRSPDGKKKYELGAASRMDLLQPSCETPGRVCWHLGSAQLSTLVPIYFDNQHDSLLGYIDLSLTPQFDITLLFGFFIALCVGSFIQARGLQSRLLRLSSTIGSQLDLWATHVREHPKASIQDGDVPFENLRPLSQALSGLNRQIEKLETQASDSAKLSIVRGVSHDILTSVSLLQQQVSLLDLEVKTGKTPTQERTARIRRYLKRLAAIAQQTRILQPMREDLPPAPPLDIMAEVDTLLSDLATDPDIESNPIELAHLKPADGREPCTAQIRSEEFIRILDNLVRNAANAVAKDGSGKVTVSTLMEEGHPILVVSDNGKGIAPEIRSRIFDLDFTTRPGIGTGLGLSIVRELCERNRAEIRFESAVGTGTEFRVRFQPGAQCAMDNDVKPLSTAQGPASSEVAV